MKQSTLKYGAVGLVFVAILLLYFFNPEVYPIYPKCPFLTITGYKCPGCGSLRFVHSLLHGDLVGAWHYNPLLLGALPFLLLLFYVSIARKTQKWAEQWYLAFNSKISISLLTIIIIIWWVGRNL